MDADINFYFDPVCPFAWMTSKWVRQVQAQRDYTVDWRFISLRLINAHVDYDAHFPPEYEAGHTAGLRLLRVAARARAEHGRESMAALYAAMGARIFDVAADLSNQRSESEVREGRGTREFVEPILAEAGLPLALAQALDDETWDAEIRQETDEALALTGKDVGTPIIHFEPPAGVAFFGPVISRLPDEDSAAEMWDHVVGLARFPGFAELKRSLREQPQLAALGVDADTVGRQEDWHGGSRRQKSDRSVRMEPMSQANIRYHQESVEVQASAEVLYDLVSDITRTGQWSPVCTSCWWDDEDTAGKVGAWFTGRNELPHRSWETRSQIVAAERGREFAWAVGGSFVRWGYLLTPTAAGTTLTETWEFLPAGIAMFEEKFGDEAYAQITDRTRQALDGIPKTLAAIKQIAESTAAGQEARTSPAHSTRPSSLG